MKRWGIGLLIVFFIGIMIYKWPTSIDKQLLGIKYQTGSMNRDFAEPVKIWIIGTYYNNLLKNDVFKGEILITGEPMTTLDYISTMEPIKFFKGLKANRGNLTYYCSNRYLGQSVEHYWVYGSIDAVKDFSNFAITVLTPNDIDGKITDSAWHSENGIVIAAPAINRDQAIKVTQNFFYVEK